MINKYQKAYRFAVYGRAASGKTCILAALAMKCIAHPSKFTCTWILEPVGMPKPQGAPETWDVGDQASAFHLGKIWLEKAIERLSRGELPPPNPNRAEPLRYLYHFTTPNHRTYPVELIDYSGELIDPAISNDDMAKRLREHLSAMDGILVLAEVPRPEDEKSQPLTGELLKLEQAFAILKNENREGPTLDIPLALLINKWDRRSPLRYTTPENEYRELHRFLEKKPEPPHKALIDALKYSVTKENFQVFPVSAFGEHELASSADDAIIERPKSVLPLQSFGLEDGFIWAAQRRDTIDIKRFEEEVLKRSSWCFLRNASVILSLPLISKGRSLAKRFPAKSPERKRIKQTLKQYFLTITANALCFLVILFSILSVGEGIYDNFRYRFILSTKSDPQATLQNLKDDEDWLASYYRAPFYRHVLLRRLVMKSDEAMATLSSFRGRREEMYWRPVEETTDELLRVELARKYLHFFGENGIYNDLANSIVTEAVQAKKYLENQSHITNIATAFEAALLRGAQNEEELENLYQQLRTLPFTDAVTADLYGQQKNILARIATEKIKHAKDKGKAKWLINRDQYFEAMREGDIVLAVKFLDRMLSQAVARDETAKLAVDFQKRAMTEFKNRINAKSRKKLWGQARNILQHALDNQQLVEQLGAQQLKQLQSLHDLLDIGEDKELYSQVVRYKDQEHITQYLKYAPLKKMERFVSRYQQNLNRLSNPLQLKLVLDNINWGGSCRNSDLFVTFNGKTIIEKTDFSPPKDGVSSQSGSTRFRAKLSDIVKVYAKITCSSWWTGSHAGEVNWEGTVGSLRGLRLKLDSKDSANRTISFALSGLPGEPVLPAWGS
ncbi:MAG: hypothetical protein KAS94_08520 [Desulfobulbaceae bacterium]|nr:hypothetical protein [Desulfobulbaceae bacterium]